MVKYISCGGKTEDELREIAIKKAQDADGSWNDKDALANLVAMITIDIPALKMREAKRILDDGTKTFPGKEYSGQTCFDGFPPRDWNPKRIVRGDDGKSMYLECATIKYILADARRSRKHANESTASANLKQAEYEAFSEWVNSELVKGHGDLTFGRFINDTGILVEKKVA